MKGRALIIPFLFIVTFFIHACGMYQNPNVHNLRDQAKLELKVLFDWYMAAYRSTSEFLNNPYVKESAKEKVRREISPKINALKYQLIELFDLLDNSAIPDTELYRQVKLLEENFKILMTQMKELGVVINEHGEEK